VHIYGSIRNAHIQNEHFCSEINKSYHRFEVWPQRLLNSSYKVFCIVLKVEHVIMFILHAKQMEHGRQHKTCDYSRQIWKYIYIYCPIVKCKLLKECICQVDY